MNACPRSPSMASRIEPVQELADALSRDVRRFELGAQHGERALYLPVKRLLREAESSRDVCDTRVCPVTQAKDQSVVRRELLEGANHRALDGLAFRRRGLS